MKKILHLILLLRLANIALAQAPQGIPYQAVARNSSGAILASTAISVRFTIHDSTATGTAVYQETFHPTTTAQGMFAVNVGQGTPVTGTFSGINWGTNAKFMQVELDPAGGSSYTDMGTQQMMSVPYALYAGNAASFNSGLGSSTLTGLTITTSTPYVQGAGSFVVGGNIIADGGLAVSAKGVCWSTTPNPTIALSTKTTNGYGGGFFTNIVNSLMGDITYYIRAYATNDSGTFYGNQVIFKVPLIAGSSFAGGIVAYILVPGDPGYVAGETHGLIAAPGDEALSVPWGFCFAGATDQAIGAGAGNTATILSVCPTTATAAQICHDYAGGGYTDWYLPSRNELEKIYSNKALIGGFGVGYYWSSSEFGYSIAWAILFNDGSSESPNKTSHCNVRAVRSF